MPIHGREAVSYSNAWVRSTKVETSWIWDGVIAENLITLLSAPAKTGKTTLLSLLLDRRREGGQLLGRAVRPGRTILCSEEEDNLWALRQPPLDFGSQLEFHKPQALDPTPRSWRRFMDHLLELPEDAFDLLVIDTVMSFAPAGLNQPRALRAALQRLRMFEDQFAGVLLLHQASAPRSGVQERGPLRGFVDILIDMQVPPGDRLTRRRHFHGVGRLGVLQFVAADLNPEGTDYLLVDEAAPEPAGSSALETLRHLLSHSPVPLTRQEILALWPQGEPPPHADSLWRCLTRGCERGLFVRSGAGTKTEAFRYGLASVAPDSKQP